MKDTGVDGRTEFAQVLSKRELRMWMTFIDSREGPMMSYNSDHVHDRKFG